MAETGKIYVTMRAGDQTLDEDRHHDGKLLGWGPANVPIPAPGSVGYLMGIPGVMRRGPEGLEWEMTGPPPRRAYPGPPWAQALAKELAEIRRLLERGSA